MPLLSSLPEKVVHCHALEEETLMFIAACSTSQSGIGKQFPWVYGYTQCWNRKKDWHLSRRLPVSYKSVSNTTHTNIEYSTCFTAPLSSAVSYCLQCKIQRKCLQNNELTLYGKYDPVSYRVKGSACARK